MGRDSVKGAVELRGNGELIKREALEDEENSVDYVMTFEELQAVFTGKNIDVSLLEETPLDNASYFGRGMVFSKFTGSRGKSGSNDANAEYIARIRKMMDDAKICYQTAELGKVDVGGGGTIAYILSLYGMEVIDCGVAVLNMHAPWEITSKADVYETFKGYKVFLKEA